MINLSALLAGAAQMRASDVHLAEGMVPYLRIRGDLKRVDAAPLTREDIQAILQAILPERLRPALERDRGADFAYVHEAAGRFRAVAYYADGKLCFTLRSIPVEIPTIEELGLPAKLKEIALSRRGMILVTGITGSGKSTTLAAMINEINQAEARRIITIEDPVEFRYTNKKAMISQREVGSDVGDFAMALRQAMRANPDVILVGEMRDLETIRIAIKAAETGHLLFSTLHTTGAIHTIERILAHFETLEHALVREQLGLNLRAVISQRLVKTADRKGRLAALELLVVNAVVKKLILDNRVAEIHGVMTTREEGMQIMDQALGDFVRAKSVEFEEAAKYCNDYYTLRRFVQGVGSSGDRGGILGGG